MIKTESLTMRYGSVKALNKVSFEIDKGEVIGLLGPNGAGKSTTLKIITTYIYPTAGIAYVGGKDVRHDPLTIRKMIGYLPEQLPLYMDMEVVEYLRFVGNARGFYGRNLQQRLDWVVDKCGLRRMYRKPIRELSKGFKQRTALAQALLHDPEILILDEPTSGLDPHQILEIRSLVRELAEEKTIIFSTHILQEVQAIANRLLIVNRGRLVADGDKEQLLADTMKEGQRIRLLMPKGVNKEEASKKLNSLENVHKVACGDRGDEVVYEIFAEWGKNAQNSVARLLCENQWDFSELRNDPYTLEELFLALTEPEKGSLATA